MKALRKNDIQTLTELEHVLRRPGIYIGSVREELTDMLLYEADKMVKRQVPFMPGLQKVIEEAIDNSIDEAIRTKFKYADTIEVWYKDGVVRLRDNGRGLPIEQDSDGVWVPESIYTKLRTGSNFDDEVRAQEAMKGMNGVGVSLTNIFSSSFKVRTANGAKSYEQDFKASGTIKSKPKVGKSERNYTELEFVPNLDYFQPSEELQKLIPTFILRYLKNSAFCYPEITFKFNGQKVASSSIKSFVGAIHEVYEYSENESVRLAVFCSEDGFEHLSFVNGIETRRGGTHIENVAYLIQDHIREHIKKRYKLDIKPADIKNKLFIMLSCRIPAPDFDGQTKERLISQWNDYYKLFDGVFNERFLKSLSKNEEIIAPIVESYRIKEQVKDKLELAKMNKGEAKKVRVEKYMPATKERKYLVLTEGDSAKGGISAGLGREQFSYFPLRGKMMNSLEAQVKKITDNEEIKNIVQILQLRLDKDVQDGLRYSNVLIATDQDADGLHIRALALAFFYRFSPSLLRQGRIKFLQTPLIIAKKGDKIVDYYFSLEEYNKAVKAHKGCEVKYMKGLGTWRPEDLQRLFKEHGVAKFIVDVEYDDRAASAIEDWMSSKTVDKRKDALRNKSFSIDEV